MRTIHKGLIQGGALILAAALGQCNGGNTSGVDGGTADLAEPTPDLSTVIPQLALTAVTPRAAVNTGGTQVTLTGTNFLAGATVTFNGVPATNVTVVSSTQITCTVPAKAATCGAATVQVSNTDGKQVSSTTVFNYQSATMAFGTANALTMAATTRYVIAVDLDKDQDLDLVSANSGLGAGNLTVRLNNGNGTFANPTTLALGGMSPYAVAAGFLDADTNIDLIAVRNAGNDVRVRLGVGDGTFNTPATDTFSVGAGPVDIALGDIDGDKRTDAMVVNNGSNNVSVLISNGDGTFKTATTTTLLGTGPTAIVLGNLDNDGKLDFATTDRTSDAATARLGIGNGTFGTGAAIMGLNSPTDLLLADFNGDNILDLAAANSSTRTIRLTIGVGNGTFNSAQGSTPLVGTTAASARSIAAGDFNLDGFLDLAVTNQADRNVSILLGQGNGSFATKQDITLGLLADPTQVVVGDLNKDGLPDIVSTDQSNNGVTVLLNQCN